MSIPFDRPQRSMIAQVLADARPPGCSDLESRKHEDRKHDEKVPALYLRAGGFLVEHPRTLGVGSHVATGDLLNGE